MEHNDDVIRICKHKIERILTWWAKRKKRDKWKEEMKKKTADFILNNQCEHSTHFPISNFIQFDIRCVDCQMNSKVKKRNFKFCCISCSCPFFPVGFPICHFFLLFLRFCVYACHSSEGEHKSLWYITGEVGSCT